jgi:hypothetical protein
LHRCIANCNNKTVALVKQFFIRLSSTKWRQQIVGGSTIYNTKYNTEYRIQNTGIQYTGYGLQVYVIRNTYTPFGATDVLHVHIDTSGTSTYEST